MQLRIDVAMETLMLKCCICWKRQQKEKINFNYTYARFYEKADILKRHKD